MGAIFVAITTVGAVGEHIEHARGMVDLLTQLVPHAPHVADPVRAGLMILATVALAVLAIVAWWRLAGTALGLFGPGIWLPQHSCDVTLEQNGTLTIDRDGSVSSQSGCPNLRIRNCAPFCFSVVAVDLRWRATIGSHEVKEREPDTDKVDYRVAEGDSVVHQHDLRVPFDEQLPACAVLDGDWTLAYVHVTGTLQLRGPWKGTVDVPVASTALFWVGDKRPHKRKSR